VRWKKFLKPNLFKIVFSIVGLILIFYSLFVCYIVDVPANTSCVVTVPLSIPFFLILEPIGDIIGIGLMLIIGLISIFATYYVIACILNLICIKVLKKPNCVQVLTLLTIIFIVIIFSVDFIYPPTSIRTEQECRAILATQCVYCKNLNWSGRHETVKNLQKCAEIYWPDRAPKDFSDCSGIKQFCDEIVGEIYQP